MENLFFNTDYSNFELTIIKLLLFSALSGILLYLMFFAFSKFLFKKSKHRRELMLRLTFLWSVFAMLILFNAYVFMLFYKTGIDNMDFSKWKFYLGIMTQIVIYLFVIIFFYIKRYSLIKLLNEKSLN